MKIPKLQKHKMKNIIKRNGISCVAKRTKTDKRGQPILDDDGKPVLAEVATFKGIFHEAGSGFTFIIGDAGTLNSKPNPAILCMTESLLDETGNIQIMSKDLINVGSLTYKVVTPNDLGNVGLFTDISLELVLNEFQV